MKKPYVVAWTFQVVFYILQMLLLRFNCEPWQYILPPDWWLCCPSFGLCYLLYFKLAESRSLILLEAKTMTFQAVFYILQRFLPSFSSEPWYFFSWLLIMSNQFWTTLSTILYKLAQSRSLILLRGKTRFTSCILPLPWHDPPVQLSTLDTIVWPLQPAPPPEGAGFEHVRV